MRRLNGLSLIDEPPSSDSSCNEEAEISNPPGQLIFEFLERELPFTREPLVDKVGPHPLDNSGLLFLGSCPSNLWVVMVFRFQHLHLNFQSYGHAAVATYHLLAGYVLLGMSYKKHFDFYGWIIINWK